MSIRGLLAFITLALIAIQPAWATDTTDPAAACSALKNTDFSTILDAPTQVMAADPMAAEGDVPAYCRVQGYITPNVGIELQLPLANWNGKFLKLGCGGHCGTLLPQMCAPMLRRGYACIVSDMGHKSTGYDTVWAYNNLPAEIDWGYRATHVTTLAGKAITTHYYQRKPQYSYYMGCSTGGHQGMAEAQRFPWDFNGIVVGAPVTDRGALYLQFAWNVLAVKGKDGKPILGEEQLTIVNDAVLEQCDQDDGVRDGIVGNPLACTFKPEQTACRAGRKTGCLNPAQVAAVEKLYQGPVSSSGLPLYTGGLVRGSELGGWQSWYLGTEDGKPSIGELFALNGFRYLNFSPDPGPTWQLSDIDFDRDYQRLGVMESLYTSNNPDLRKFKAAGGKLLVYQGINDAVIPPQNIIDYYQTAEKVMGGRQATQDFFRLFLLPGVDHCAGGPGAYAVDYLSYLEDWVERGKAPNRLLSKHPKEPLKFPADHQALKADDIQFTRPVYPYPLRARYKGQGDPNDADNFIPWE